MLPTATLMPAGLDVTLSPVRPVAVTVSVTACPGDGGGGVTVSAFTVSEVLALKRCSPLIVTVVSAVVDVVVIGNVALAAPASPGTAPRRPGHCDRSWEAVSLATNPPAGAAS